MRKAFVFGKFLPFHKGHAAMIDFAASACDELVVLICCSNLETIPASLRKKWLVDTYGHRSGIEVRVFAYDEADLPNTSVSSAEVSRVWAAAFKQLLPACDSLITSEDYGPLVAGYMGITHIPFDPGRRQVPVSATEIRKNVRGNWQYVPDAVREDYITKVVILGTESTGKTTLTGRLARHFNCGSVMEAGRDLIADSTSFSMDDLYKVAAKHADDIARASRGDSPLLIIDTDIHITLSYGRMFFGEQPVVNADIYRQNKASLYLYLNNDVAYVQDGTRLSEEDRNLLDISHRKILYDHHIAFEEITGDWEARFEQAVMLIGRLLTGR